MANKKISADTGREEGLDAHQCDIQRGLIEYCRFPHPQGFAVMLDGPWGSGKTHFIKKILDDLTPRATAGKQHKPLYVSLYGVKDTSEIGDQLFQQLHPVLSHKATRLVGAVVRAAAKAAIKVDLGHAVQASGTLPDLDLSSMLSGTDGRIIIFDDFERSTMGSTALLGHINPLVEHDGCKVIILSDESKVGNQEDYRERKEKTVGRTFEFKPNASVAFKAFMELIDDKDAQTFLTASQDDVLKVFEDSGLDNLRLLKQFLWDFERLWKTLSRRQKEHTKAMHELVCLLCASAIELRSGRLTGEVFRRNDIIHHLNLQTEKPDEATKAAQEVFKRYPTVRFDSTLLGRDTIVELVLKSKLPLAKVQRELNQHPHFAKPEEMPSWRALWLSSETAVEEHDAIVARFEADFGRRAFRDESEILHIIGLSLWLSEMHLPNWDGPDLLDKMKHYISDIYKGASGPGEMLAPRRDVGTEGAFGLGYMNLQDPRFKELSDFHAEQREAWHLRGYPAIAVDLQKLMTRNSEAFLRDICFTNGGTARFARRAVLKHIQADQFASTVATARYHDQKEVLMALSIRYDQVTAEPELESELPWLNEVLQHLCLSSRSLPPISRYHLNHLTEMYLSQTIAKAEERLRNKYKSLPKPISP